MPGKRLFDQSSRESDWVLIPQQDRHPLSSATGRWGIAVCLQSALQSAGTDISYARLMGLLNTAFACTFDPQFDPEKIIEKASDRVRKTLAGLGFAEASPGKGTPDQQRAVREIEGGRPFLCHRWDDATRDWSLIFGVGPDALQWRGYLFAPQPEQIQTAASCSRSVFLGAPTTAPPDEQVEREALEDAVKSYEQHLPGFHERWAQRISPPDIFTDDPQGDESILRHEWFAETHLDARDCAARFFRNMAQKYPVMREAFAAVADLFGRIVETLESRRPPIFSEMAADMLRDPAVALEWANRLREAGRIEEKAMQRMWDTLRMAWH